MAFTVTTQEAIFAPSFVCTVTAAVPGATAVTTPVEDTVATDVLLDTQETDLSVALAGVTVAANVPVSPSVSVMLVLSRVTPVTEITFDLTVTEHTPTLPPSSEVALIEVLPCMTAVTFPSWSTLTNDSLPDRQVTVLTEALDGLTVAVSLAFSPSVIDSDSGLTVTDSTATYLPFLPAWFNLMLAEPELEVMDTEPSRSYSLFSAAVKVTFH